MSATIEQLLYEEESSTLDFKEEQYPFDKAADVQKGELLKDILAFANAWRRSDAFILIGVEEVKGGKSRVIGISEHLDDARLQQFVNTKTQRPITFEYKGLLLEGRKIGVIRIPVQIRPIYLKKDYGGLKGKEVYIRRGSSTAVAEPDEIAKMGEAKQEIYKIEPEIKIEFAESEKRLRLGSDLEISITMLLVPKKEEIPDYEEKTFGYNYPRISIGGPNNDFYRELAEYYYWREICGPFAFYIENVSGSPALGVKVELSAPINERYGFLKKSEIPREPSRSYYPDFRGNMVAEQLIKPDTKITKAIDKWLIEIEIPRLQPRSSYCSTENVYFFSLENLTVNLEVAIYSDNLPVPIKSRLSIRTILLERPGDLSTLLRMYMETPNRS